MCIQLKQSYPRQKDGVTRWKFLQRKWLSTLLSSPTYPTDWLNGKLEVTPSREYSAARYRVGRLGIHVCLTRNEIVGAVQECIENNYHVVELRVSDFVGGGVYLDTGLQSIENHPGEMWRKAEIISVDGTPYAEWVSSHAPQPIPWHVSSTP